MKTINDLLAPYPHFSLSRPSDNQDILDFFKTVTMDTKAFSLRYDRGSDFFEFTREQSERVYIFLMRDEKNIIRGCASVALIPHNLNGKRELCAYLGDLRISSKLSPKIRILWKKCYGEIIANFNQLEEFKGINFLYSAILDDNQSAMRSLLKNNDQLYYHELSKYQTINIFAPKFLSGKKSKNFSIARSNESELRNFLATVATRPGMQNFITHNPAENDELSRRLKCWKNFSVDDFITIKDESGKMVATAAPWISESKKLVIERMNKPLKVLGMLVPLFRIPPITEKKPIKIMYLTHLNFAQDLSKAQKEEVLKIMINKVFKTKKRNFHLLSFFNFPHWELGELPFYSQTTHARFYQIMSKSQFENQEFFDLAKTAPAFELGIS